MTSAAPLDKRDAQLRGCTVVVTGGGGFLGRVLVRKLRERGCRNVIVPRSSSCDLTHMETVSALFEETKPDYVLHLAAAVENPPGQGNAADCMRSNVLMATHIVEAARRQRVRKLVLLGSAVSYPEHAAMPLREDDLFCGVPEASRAGHGVAKLLSLFQAQTYRRQYGLSSIFLIPTNFYGPGDNFEPGTSYVIPSLIRTFVQAAAEGWERVTIRGSGRGTRDFLHVEDCADGILQALATYDQPEAVNLGSGVETSIASLAGMVADLAGYTGEIAWDTAYPDGAARRFLDISRARRAFDFHPRVNLRDGLCATLAWYRTACRGPAFDRTKDRTQDSTDGPGNNEASPKARVSA